MTYARPHAPALGALPSSDRSVRERETVRRLVSDTTMVRLFCLWVFLQCFDYKALNSLRWNLGIVMSPDRFIFGVMLLAYTMRVPDPAVAPRHRDAATRMLGLFLLLFGLIGSLSLWIAAPDADSPTFGHLTRLTNIALLPLVSYVAARRLQYTRAMLREIVVFFTVLGTYLAFTALCEHFGVRSLVFPKYILDPNVGITFGRSRGPFVDPIGDGGMLLIAFLASSALSSSLTGVKRVMQLLPSLLFLPAIYFTETRAVWLGLAAITATLIGLRTPMRRAAAIVCCAILAGFLSGVSGKFSIGQNTLFSRRQNTVDYRLDNYQTAWKAFTANPVFGVGFGTFHLEWSNYFASLDARTRGLDDGNHSTPLGLLAELGLTGFTPFLGSLACSVVICLAAYRRLRQGPYEFERTFVILGLGAIEAYVILGLTNDLHSMPTVDVTTFWLVGIVSTLHAGSIAPAGDRSGPAGARAIGPRRSWHPRPPGAYGRWPRRTHAYSPESRVGETS